MRTRKVIYADYGMVLTDGKHYGKQIFLSEDSSPYDYWEITEEEYESILRKNEETI